MGLSDTNVEKKMLSRVSYKTFYKCLTFQAIYNILKGTMPSRGRQASKPPSSAPLQRLREKELSSPLSLLAVGLSFGMPAWNSPPKPGGPPPPKLPPPALLLPLLPPPAPLPPPKPPPPPAPAPLGSAEEGKHSLFTCVRTHHRYFTSPSHVINGDKAQAYGGQLGFQ